MLRPTLISSVEQPEPTIRDKIIETLHSNRVTSENKRIISTPLPSTLQNGVFIVFYRKIEQQHNIAWRGWESQEKLYFPFKKSVKHQKAPLRRSVSTNFVTNSAPKQVPSVGSSFSA